MNAMQTGVTEPSSLLSVEKEHSSAEKVRERYYSMCNDFEAGTSYPCGCCFKGF